MCYETPGRPAHELCHDLIESAAAIGVLAQITAAEASGADPIAAARLRGQLDEIAMAARQIAEICERVLKPRGATH